MPAIKTIPEIVSPIAPIAQYLSVNDSAEKKIFNNADLDPLLAAKIYTERKTVEWMYNRNSGEATLRGTANYLYDLLGKYALLAIQVLFRREQAPPVVSGPLSLAVNVGDNAVFTISVISGLSYTIQWYRNGVQIPGAIGLSYTLTNAQLSDSGALFSAIVTNSAGSASSANATLTVTSALQGQWWWGDTDHTAELAAGIDNVPWNEGGVFSIVDGQPFVITMPEAAENNHFFAFRYPDSQAPRVQYQNPPLNNGVIPNIIFAPNVAFGGKRYTYTSQQASFELTSTPLTLI